MSFWVAVNFHPMWLAQILHWATVQANLQQQGRVSWGDAPHRPLMPWPSREGH